MDRILDYVLSTGISFDAEFLAKVLGVITTIIIAYNRIKRQLSNFHVRSVLKSDLEILKFCRENGINDVSVREKIDNSLKKLYESKQNLVRNSLTEVMVGLFLFFGFGLWTVEIYSDNNGFSGWMVVTIFFSLAGLNSIFYKKKTQEKESENRTTPILIGFRIESLQNCLNGLFTTVVCLLIAIVWYAINGFTFWQIIPLMLAVIGLGAIIQQMKFEMKPLDTDADSRSENF